MKIRRNPLDILFSRFIRLRDKGTCQRCGRHLGLTSGLHCSHFIKRRYKATRWNESNCCALCFGCHQHFEENHAEYEHFMVQKIGQQGIDLLQAQIRVPARYIDIKAIHLYLKEELRKLDDN